jgi:hypothetical protein
MQRHSKLQNSTFGNTAIPAEFFIEAQEIKISEIAMVGWQV